MDERQDASFLRCYHQWRKVTAGAGWVSRLVFAASETTSRANQRGEAAAPFGIKQTLGNSQRRLETELLLRAKGFSLPRARRLGERTRRGGAGGGLPGAEAC